MKPINELKVSQTDKINDLIRSFKITIIFLCVIIVLIFTFTCYQNNEIEKIQYEISELKMEDSRIYISISDVYLSIARIKKEKIKDE